MKSNLYEYASYKKFLNDLIHTYPSGGRGQRKLLAEFIGCQVAYVTHVLSGERDFNLEQAESAARYFSLNRGETEYFLCLVQENRAATIELRRFFERQLRDIRERNSRLKEKLNFKDLVPNEAKLLYYSSWLYSAVHMSLTIPGLRTVAALSEKFQASSSHILEILEFLCKYGLAYKENNLYKTKTTLLHLEKDSPLVARHHSNWRLRALTALDEVKENNFHYSSVVSVSKKDAVRVQEHLMKAFLEIAEIIKPSKEEELVGLCLDMFHV